MSEERRDATWFFDRIKYQHEFTVTEEHVALARRANVRWHYTEWGAAPGLDLKRPYGNSDWHADVAEIVEGAFLNAMGDGAREDYIEANTERWERLHAEMALAMQIFLTTQQFDMGRYRSQIGGRWIKAD